MAGKEENQQIAITQAADLFLQRAADRAPGAHVLIRENHALKPHLLESHAEITNIVGRAIERGNTGVISVDADADEKFHEIPAHSPCPPKAESPG